MRREQVGLSSIRREGLYAKGSKDTISLFFGTNDSKVQEYYKAGGDRRGIIQDAFVTDLSAAARTVFTILVSAATQTPLQRAPLLAHPLVRQVGLSTMGVKFVTGADASNAIAEQTDKAITLFTLLEIILRLLQLCCGSRFCAHFCATDAPP
jgi:hypothetical protein